MVHHRLNEREANPNEHINFITPLPARDESAARSLLRALAAQVKPVMKSHGFSVNSFEEYEHNTVFLGRNWNNGETIEIVLRRANGSFYRMEGLLNTLCHELAHIKYMDHSRMFHQTWNQLRSEVDDLRARGYFGDGLWSGGTRLGDSAQMLHSDIPNNEEEPEYICGGAQKQSRRTARRRIRRQSKPLAGKTGAQTEKRGKPGRRIRGDDSFVGAGKALNDDLQGNAKQVGVGFRKKAGSKSAREARAEAAARRIAQLTAGPSRTTADDESDDSDSDDEDEDVAETNDDRRRLLLDSMHDAGEEENGLDLLRNVQNSNVDISCRPSMSSHRPGEPSSSKVSALPQPISTAGSTSQIPAKRKRETFMEAEITQRKREALGMDRSRKLGGEPSASTKPRMRAEISSTPEIIEIDDTPFVPPQKAWGKPTAFSRL